MVLCPTVAEINISSFKNNLRLLRKIAGDRKHVLVVKADAYGHGIIQMSNAALNEGIYALAVATVNEGVKIRQGGITAPIIVLFEHSKSESELVCRYNLSPVISSDSCISNYDNYLKRFDKTLNVHIEVDTGLSRMGLNLEDVLDFTKKVLSYERLKVEGICTHFAGSDGDDDASLAYTKKQIYSFNNIINVLSENNIDIKYIHAASSAGTLYYPESHFNMVRFGISAYGYSPNRSKNPGFKPVMSLKSKVIFVKKIKEGVSVSYGMTWTAKKDTHIALIPIGYADGFSRKFSNNGKVKIKDKYYPVIGRICMDQTIVDIGNDKIYPEDDVLIFGDDNILNADTLADKLGDSICYEVLTAVGNRVERVYIE